MSEVLAGQVLRFQWNAYSSSWGPALRDLRTAGLFHDLTLVTADNTAVSAHKLVLAACSAFFKGKYFIENALLINILQLSPQGFSPPSLCPPRVPCVPP